MRDFQVGTCDLLFILASVLAAVPAAGQGLYLGFADSTGSRVIVTEYDGAEPRFLWGILPSGETVALAFCEAAPGTDGNNHRHTAYNFDNLPGLVFRVAEDPLEADGTCPLATSSFLAAHAPLSVTPLDMSAPDEETRRRIQESRGMELDSAWRLAGVGDEAEVLLVLFQPGDSTVVASMVFSEGDDLRFEDYVGDRSGDMQSVWRVDDGGRFDPGGFEVIAAFRTGAGIEIVRTWIGAEGENTVWLVPGESGLEPALTYYRYQAPL